MPLVQHLGGPTRQMTLVGYFGTKRLFIGDAQSRVNYDVLRKHNVALAVDTRKDFEPFRRYSLWTHEPR